MTWDNDKDEEEEKTKDLKKSPSTLESNMARKQKFIKKKKSMDE